MSQQNLKKFSTAFPAFPSQDQFGRPVAVFPGMTILDYFALTIFANNLNHVSPEEAVAFAENLIHKLYETQSEGILQENSPLSII